MWTTFAMDQYRPLTWMTYAGDFALWGMQPRGFHLTSLLLHVAVARILFGLLVRLVPGDTFAAWLGAGLFALPPLRVEPVAWLSARADVLATGAVLLATWAWLRRLD